MESPRDPRLTPAPSGLKASVGDIKAALRTLGLDDNDEMVQQFSFFLEAMNLYDLRGRKYGDAWKAYGFTDSMFHVRSKAARLQAVGANPEAGHCLDDGIDLLNYTVFAMRNALEGRQ